MRHKYWFLLIVLMGFVAMTGCARMLHSNLEESSTQNIVGEEKAEKSDATEEKQSTSENRLAEYSYEELENMEGATVRQDCVWIVLEENQAIPYRWIYEIQGNAELLQEDTVDGQGVWNEAGNSPAYHVFAFEIHESGQAEIKCYLARIDDSTEVSEEQSYLVMRDQNGITCKRFD